MNFMSQRSLMAAVAVVTVLAALPNSSAQCVVFSVTADTSSVAGTNGNIEFQFNPGSPTSASATATILNFNPGGGTLGAASVTGSVSGSLPGPVTFQNNTPFNDLFQGFTFGSNISFLLQLCGPAITSPSGTAGTTFSFSLEDMFGNPILTNSPSGAVFQVDINPNGTTTATAFPTATGGPSVVTFALLANDAFQVNYAANLSIADSVINITNNGASGGNICVNVYGFSPDEQMISCCSCLVTPNGLNALSVAQDVLSNTLTPVRPNSVVIKLLASTPNQGSCNAATPTLFNLASGLDAWATTVHPVTSTNIAVTDKRFLTATLSPGELARLTNLCAFAQGQGSGFGRCKSCRIGGF